MPKASNSSITFRVASSRTDFIKAFKLVFQDRLRKGFTATNPHGLLFYWQHLMPGSVVFLAEKGDEVVGTVSLIRKEQGCTLPLEDTFDLGSRWDFSKRIVEVCGLAIAPEYRGQTAKVLYPLYGLIQHYTQYHCPVDVLIFAIHPKDARFYDQQLFAKPIFDRGSKSKPKAYVHANNAPAILRFIEFPNWTNDMRENGKRHECNDLLSDSLFRFDAESFSAPEKDPFQHSMSAEDVKYFLGRIKQIKVVPTDVGELISEAYRFTSYVKAAENTQTTLLPRADRVDIKGGAEIQFENSTVPARIINASESGFKAVLDRELPLSLFNLLKVKIISAAGIVLVARPVWRDGKQVGFSIVSKSNNWSNIVKKALHEETFNFGSEVCLSRIMRDVDITNIRIHNEDNYKPDPVPAKKTLTCNINGAVWVDGLIFDVQVIHVNSQEMILNSQCKIGLVHGSRYNLFMRYNSGMMLEIIFTSIAENGDMKFKINGCSEQLLQTLADLDVDKNAGKMSKDSFRAA